MMQARHLRSLLIAAFFAAAPVSADDGTRQGLETLRQAAEQGNADAQYELGILYEFGFHFPDHKVAAYTWYSRAAAQGNAAAEQRRDALRAHMSAAERERAEAETKLTPPTPVTAATTPGSTTEPSASGTADR